MKGLTEEGNYGEIEVISDPVQGYVLRAKGDIPQFTLLCEYAGQVRSQRESSFIDNDSIMQLLIGTDSDQSLCIVPQTKANLGRFFSGINNQTASGR